MVKKEKKFEEAIAELEQIVKALEGGNVPLDEALEKFQAGIALSKFCNETLTNAENTVNQMLVMGQEQVVD